MWSSTGTVQRRASVLRAGPSPPLDRMAGWIPREISWRSCETPVRPPTMSEICSLSEGRSGGTEASAVRIWRPNETSRCCAPSCRSRSKRRRAPSAAATILAREAVSSARVWAFAIAIATRSAKSARRASVSAGRRSARDEPTNAAPHRRPSTMTGTPTTEPMPASRIRTASGPLVSAWSSILAAHPVRSTKAPTSLPANGIRSPTTGRFVIPGSY